MEKQIDICATCEHDELSYCSVIGTIPHCCSRHWHCEPGGAAKDYKPKSKNCHGCKWLDENKSQPKGNGYCSTVVSSKTYKPGFGGQPSDKVRKPDMPRCELYEPGDFKTRFEKAGE